MTSMMVKKRISHDVHLQLRFCVTAAPSKGPKAGLHISISLLLDPICVTYPKKGAATYSDIGPDRFSGCQRSLSVPDPMLRLGAAKNPAKKRRTTRVAMFFAKPVPRMNSAKIGRLIKMTGFLPKLSESGAANGPPNASPSW